MKLSGCKLIILFASIIMLPACATTTKVDTLGSTYQAKDKKCEIQFFKDEQPQNNYEIIGKIESHIKKNLFFGGKVQLEDEAFKELRIKACSLV